MKKTRKRMPQTTSLAERLEEARKLRERAEQLAPGPGRNALLRTARNGEAAAKIDAWLTSPGLRPPISEHWSTWREFQPVIDMKAQAEKLRKDAAECALIRDLTTDPAKRDLFTRVSKQLLVLAQEVERVMEAE